MGSKFDIPSDLTPKRIVIDQNDVVSGTTLTLSNQEGEYRLRDRNFDGQWDAMETPRGENLTQKEYLDHFNKKYPKERITRMIDAQMVVCQKLTVRAQGSFLDDEKGWSQYRRFKDHEGDYMLSRLGLINGLYVYLCSYEHPDKEDKSLALSFKGRPSDQVYQDYIYGLGEYFRVVLPQPEEK